MTHKTPSFIRWPYHAKMSGNAYPVHRMGGQRSIDDDGTIEVTWSNRPEVVVGLGGTVTYIMLQFMLAMGYKTVLAVGLDHNYFNINKMPAHFDKEYAFTPQNHPQVRVQNPLYWSNLKIMVENGYRLARQVYEAVGGRIVNLSPDSEWNGWERGDWHDWLVDNS